MTNRREFGHVYRRKNSPYWWIRYRLNGKDFRESTQSKSMRKAEELLMQRKVEMGRGDFVPPSAKRTKFADLESLLLKKYASAGRSDSRVSISIDRLREFFGQHLAQNITYEEIEGYKVKRLEAGASRSTINSELSALSKAFKLALRARKLAQMPPIDRFGQLDNARTGFFEPAAFRAVLAKLRPHWRAPMEFGYYTGWRVRSEVLTLTWAQVDLYAKVVRLEPGTTKNREGRVFPFGEFPKLEALLQAQRRMTKALEKESGQIVPWVFHRKGKRLGDYKRAWAAACRNAGHPGMRVHDLRRTAVRNLERAGVPRSVAMKLTGHKTEAVYRRYAIVAEADLSYGVDKLSRLHEAREARGTRGAHSVAGGG